MTEAGSDTPLDDARIDRYSRHILLPEVGSRGQRALLASRVRLSGGGRAVELLAAWLAGAGVGYLELPGQPPGRALRERNDDVTWGPLPSVDLIAGIGPVRDRSWPTETPVVWTAVVDEDVLCVRATRPPACRQCFEAVLEAAVDPQPERSPLLASIAATAVLGAMLRLDAVSSAHVLRFSLRPLGATRVDLSCHVH